MNNTPREIKFQAWISTAEVMIDVKSITFEDDLIVAVTDRESGAVLHLHRSFLREWTGLTDKNGVGIYEGDIISCPKGVGAIEWQKKRATFLLIDVDDDWFLGLHGSIAREDFEITGNIFENLNLLPEA